MTEDQKRHLEQRLLQERERTVEVLSSLEADAMQPEADAGELSHLPTHPADRGTDVFERQIDLSLVERQRERLRLIDDALERLREDPDSFDISIVSGRRIPFARLELIPWTRVCVDEEEPPVESRPRSGPR